MAELAPRLGLTGMGVRRHLGALLADGLVETLAAPTGATGRPPNRWRLTESARELFPRHYDALAVEIMEDIEALEPGVVEAALHCRTAKLAEEYREALESCDDLESRVAGLARLRDKAGYVAEWSANDEGGFVLKEHNCAIHRVAERLPVVCAQELALLRAVLGPDVDVTRTAHTMGGDTTCTYCIRPRSAEGALTGD